MKLRLFSSLALLALAGGWPAFAFPLTGTLPKEQSAILLCGVSDTSMAKDCGPLRATPASDLTAKTKALIEAENNAPDVLVGAKPGSRVLVMARRSLASPLDEDNAGRAASAAAPNPPLIVDPDWAVMPETKDINDYFPDRAQRMAVSGTATVLCTVGPKGDLVGCWLVAEGPEDFGFGAQLLNISTFVQMKAVTKGGAPTAGRPYALQADFVVNAKGGRPTITLSNAH